MLWPAYRAVLEDECRRQRRTLTTLRLQGPILRDRIGQAELVDRFLECYARENCDGLFLSAVTCQGVRLPVPEFVPAVSRVRQAEVRCGRCAHRQSTTRRSWLTAPHCDFLVAGCHKWLRAYHPMGLGFCCRPRADCVMADVSREMTERGQLDDPLLSFTWELENGRCEAFSETVNLAPLFTAAAAVSRIWQSPLGRNEEFDLQLANADRVAEVADSTGWQPVRPTIPMRSGILLLQAKRSETRSAPTRRPPIRLPTLRPRRLGLCRRPDPHVVPRGHAFPTRAESASLGPAAAARDGRLRGQYGTGCPAANCCTQRFLTPLRATSLRPQAITSSNTACSLASLRWGKKIPGPSFWAAPRAEDRWCNLSVFHVVSLSCVLPQTGKERNDAESHESQPGTVSPDPRRDVSFAGRPFGPLPTGTRASRPSTGTRPRSCGPGPWAPSS